jgi:arabinofuranosyltransferase
MASQNKGTLFFLFILAGYALYAGVYIYKTSFVAGGERYFVLFDDAMISMRYARNLAAGHGLVWNPGAEPVEGYTNPTLGRLHGLLPPLPDLRS